MKKVTIIVPIYNAEDSVQECVDSIVNQTYKNIEVLLINDGSSDNSLKKLDKYKKDNRVIIINKKNEGVAKTRNLGIKKATGSYVMFIDNDDYIETYINNIGNNDILIGGYERVNDSTILYKQKVYKTEWMKYVIMAPWAKLYKRSFILKNKCEFLDYKIGEDVYFNMMLISKKPKISYINYLGYKWYFNDKSVSNTSQKGLDVDIIYLLEKLKEMNNSSDIYFRYYIKRYSIWYLLFSGKNSSKFQFINYNNKINEWLKVNNLNKTFSPFSIKLKGEILKNRIIVFMFILINNIGLMNIFSRIYCKTPNKKGLIS